jgi:hypothetical protein
VQQLGVTERADATVALDLVAVEGEVHLLHAVTLGERPEGRFGAAQAAAVQHTLACFQHRRAPSSVVN